MSVEFKAHRVYVVVWPDDRIVKVGYTGYHRWRKFANIGAYVYALYVFRRCHDALDYESTLHRFLGDRTELAFASRHEAVTHLGSGGGGWMETHRVPDLAMLRALPGPPDGHCMAGPWRPFYSSDCYLPEAIHERDGRDEQTNDYSPNDEISPYVSRAGGQNESIISAALKARDVLVGASRCCSST